MLNFQEMASVSEIVSFVRQALILFCAMVLFNLPTLIYKVGMYLRGILYLLFCNDKSWKKPQDPSIVVDPILKQENESADYESVVERKTIYFVRHGESTWNDTFNKGSHRSKATFVIGFIPGLIKAVLFELYLIFSGKIDRCVQTFVVLSDDDRAIAAHALSGLAFFQIVMLKHKRLCRFYWDHQNLNQLVL